MSPLVTMVVSLTFKFCWKMLVVKLKELFQATTRSCAGPPVVTQSCLYGPVGIVGYSQTTPGQGRLTIFYLPPGTQRQPRTDKMDIKKKDMELKTLMFISKTDNILVSYMFIWLPGQAKGWSHFWTNFHPPQCSQALTTVWQQTLEASQRHLPQTGHLGKSTAHFLSQQQIATFLVSTSVMTPAFKYESEKAKYCKRTWCAGEESCWLWQLTYLLSMHDSSKEGCYQDFLRVDFPF